jgi:hypothetical protein
MKKLWLLILMTLSVSLTYAQDTTRQRLQEVVILSEMAKYKRDSARLDSIYAKTMRDVNQDVDVHLGNGVVFEGLFSKMARKISGRDKKDKKFLATYRQMQSEKVVAIRYNPRVVASVTGLKGDLAASFINQNPMPEDFARTATELELKMWIRERYKDSRYAGRK